MRLFIISVTVIITSSKIKHERTRQRWKRTWKGWRQETSQGSSRPNSRHHKSKLLITLYCLNGLSKSPPFTHICFLYSLRFAVLPVVVVWSAFLERSTKRLALCLSSFSRTWFVMPSLTPSTVNARLSLLWTWSSLSRRPAVPFTDSAGKSTPTSIKTVFFNTTYFFPNYLNLVVVPSSDAKTYTKLASDFIEK